MKIKSHKYSFTLVELMISLAILSALSGLIVFTVKPNTILDEFNDQKRLSEIKSISKAIDYLNIVSLGNLNLGVSTNIYLSLPDNTSTTCASYTLPTLPTQFSYSCKTASTYRNNDGTGWIPINFRETDNSNLLSTLPIDPTNDIYYYYSYNPGGSYEVNAFFKSTKYINEYGSKDGGDSMNAIELGTNLYDMPTTFPHNWIKVPGNPTYGTSDFWVMQYEAKYAINGKSASDSPNACDYYETYFGIYDSIWDWGKTTGGCNTVVPTWYNQNVVSSPEGSPIALITYNQARAICTSLGAHMITNAEWMTIARNAERQASNWTSGTVGSGALFAGNSDYPEYGGYTYGCNLPAEHGTNRNPRAAVSLSNGNKIYDLAANLEEYVDIDGAGNLLTNSPNSVASSGEWGNIVFLSLTGYGDLSYDLIRPSNSNLDWDNGTGWYIGYDGGSHPGQYMLRGNQWCNSAGIFHMYLDDWSGYGSAGNMITGFRCAK